ncbi:CRAL/TRIO domain-containing protein [Mycena venus]|uniref:CRAL/TRIO domain-containing protein n=1 Tax=Mycena venus TaxID=2733690 RepID=A0A8H6XT97_9AGAR|nr:CRAL/TRIO domain-containing protein [Mycena venus]
MKGTQLLLTTPPPGTKVAPIHQYSHDQHAQIDALRQYADTLLLPSMDPYYFWERRWLNQSDTLPRYMRAAKWQIDDAKKRIKATIEWRRDYKPDLIPPEEVRIESETGKIILNGFDNEGRPILYVRPGRENTQTSPRQVRHLVWCLERAMDLMPPGQESLVIIVDYKSTTLRTNPSIGVARKVLNILQRHYPETLGRAIVVNLPRVLNFFFKGISPFLDPVTRDKMRFNPNLLELIDRSQLDADFGGDLMYEFEKDSYWEQIVRACGIAEDGTRIIFSSDGDEKEGTQKVSTEKVPGGAHGFVGPEPLLHVMLPPTTVGEVDAGAEAGAEAETR